MIRYATVTALDPRVLVQLDGGTGDIALAGKLVPTTDLAVGDRVACDVLVPDQGSLRITLLGKLQ